MRKSEMPIICSQELDLTKQKCGLWTSKIGDVFVHQKFAVGDTPGRLELRCSYFRTTRPNQTSCINNVVGSSEISEISSMQRRCSAGWVFGTNDLNGTCAWHS
jgi:hypothetical protein